MGTGLNTAMYGCVPAAATPTNRHAPSAPSTTRITPMLTMAGLRRRGLPRRGVKKPVVGGEPPGAVFVVVIAT